MTRPSARASGKSVKSLFASTSAGDRLARLAALAERDPEVGALDREHVVDAVADHCDVMAGLLKGPENQSFLIRRHPSEHAPSSDQLGRVRRRIQFLSRDRRLLTERRPEPADRRPDGLGVVAREDLEGDSLPGQVLQDFVDSGSDLFAQPHEGQRPQPDTFERVCQRAKLQRLSEQQEA